MIYIIAYLALFALLLWIGPPSDVSDIPPAALLAIAAPITVWAVVAAAQLFSN